MSLDLCSNKYGYLVPLEKALEAKEQELLEVVQLLIDKGVDPSIPNADGETALDFTEGTGLEKLSALLRNSKDDYQKISYKVFYQDYKKNEGPSSSSPKTMTKESILEKIEILNEDEENFFGIIDSNGVTLQFHAYPKPKIWAEVVVKEEKGSYGAKIKYQEVVTIIKDLDGTIDKNNYSKFEFEPWS